MAAGAIVINEDFPSYGVYDANLLTTVGERIFTNPDQFTQALNANTILGGQFVLRDNTPELKVWENPDMDVEIMSSRNVPNYTYGVTVLDSLEAQTSEDIPSEGFRNKMNALKTIIENLDVPAGAARRRKTKKISRRRRITRRRY